MNQPLIAAVWYTNVRELRKMLRVVILCPFICLCCHPHQIQSPAALTRLETTHKIRLSLLTPPTGFTCTILKTSFPSTKSVFIPYNQFVGHFVKQILLVFRSCLVTLCRLLNNPYPFPSLFLSLPLPQPSRISYPSLSCLGYCSVVPSLWVTSYGFANLPNCSIPDECCVINKALRSLQFLSRLYKVVSVDALEAYFTVVGWSKVLLILSSYYKS